MVFTRLSTFTTARRACAVVLLIVACSLSYPVTDDTRARAEQHARPHWSWPLTPAVQTRAFIAPLTRYSSGHRGIDLAARIGAQITAPTSGVVSFVGRVVDREVLTVSDGGEWTVTFEAVSSKLHVGDRVVRGAPLATVSAGPHCSCVHIGVRWRGWYVNPLLVFGSLPRTVLLPW